MNSDNFKRYHHGDLKRTLLNVASQTLEKNEIGDLSLRQIAKLAGVSHTAPYKHFKDKSDLLNSIVAYEFKKIFDLTIEVSWRYPEQIHEQLLAIAETVLNLSQNQPKKFRLLLDHINSFTSDQLSALTDLGLEPDQARAYWFCLIGAAVHSTDAKKEANRIVRFILKEAL